MKNTTSQEKNSGSTAQTSSFEIGRAHERLRNEPLPLHGATNPSTQAQGTTPGSFARKSDIGGPLAFSSPDTPGMPAPSTQTAWDFLPAGWTIVAAHNHQQGCAGHLHTHVAQWICAKAPAGFEPITQLEFARLGVITKEMRRVAEREQHLTAEQVRDEIAAGRMVIPANRRSRRVPRCADSKQPSSNWNRSNLFHDHRPQA